MKLHELRILEYLAKENRDSPARSITITDLREAMSCQSDRAYITTWRYLKRLLTDGYIARQLVDFTSDMYFITQKGKDLLEAQYKPYK